MLLKLPSELVETLQEYGAVPPEALYVRELLIVNAELIPPEADVVRERADPEPPPELPPSISPPTVADAETEPNKAGSAQVPLIVAEVPLTEKVPAITASLPAVVEPVMLKLAWVSTTEPTVPRKI